jgi:hypothetical protein
MSMETGTVTDVRRIIQERGAIWAYQQFQLAHPELTSFLHGANCEHAIHIIEPINDWVELCRQFDSEIRPITVNVRLVRDPPPSKRVIPASSAFDEAWMLNEPMPQLWVDDLLCLAAPDLPEGSLTFQFDPEGYVFQHHGLTEADVERVDAAFRALKLPGTLRFAQLPASPPQTSTSARKAPPDQFLDLPVSRRLHRVSPALVRLVEQDEEAWRQFVASRRDAAQPAIVPANHRFSVLFGADDASEVRLAELLCIYDVVNVVPTYDLTWLGKHGLDLNTLEELVALGRLKLVLPAPATRYPAELIDAAAGVDDSSVMLSRRLASLTVAHGQRKDPLLYGSFSYQDRIAVLRAIQSLGQSSPLTTLIEIYSKLIEQQHRALFRRGASAAFGSGFGTLVGEAVFGMRGIDARLELSTVGAMVEWAAALGATYLPRSFGDYDESGNATIIANYFNRTRRTTTGDVADRMHLVVDGLLTTSGLSPLDVAHGMTARSFAQFRQMARGMLTAEADLDALQALVAKMNEDVRSFERRRAFLSKYKITSTLVGLAAVPLNNTLDLAFSGASVIAAWLAQAGITVLRDKGVLPPVIGPLADVIDAMRGLATMTSMDAVVIARARGELGR